MPRPENDGEWDAWFRCNVFRAPRRGFRSVVATAALSTTPPPQQTSLRWCQYDDTPRYWCTYFIITGLTAVTVHFQSTSCYDAACSSPQTYPPRKDISGQRDGVETPTSFCAMRESASRWSPSSQTFSDDMRLWCRYQSRRNAQSQ